MEGRPRTMEQQLSSLWRKRRYSSLSSPRAQPPGVSFMQLYLFTRHPGVTLCSLVEIHIDERPHLGIACHTTQSFFVCTRSFYSIFLSGQAPLASLLGCQQHFLGVPSALSLQALSLRKCLPGDPYILKSDGPPLADYKQRSIY